MILSWFLNIFFKIFTIEVIVSVKCLPMAFHSFIDENKLCSNRIGFKKAAG